MTADATTDNGFTFDGQLQGTWNNALGLKWLSFSNLDVNFQFIPSAQNPIETFTFNGNALFLFHVILNHLTSYFIFLRFSVLRFENFPIIMMFLRKLI